MDNGTGAVFILNILKNYVVSLQLLTTKSMFVHMLFAFCITSINVHIQTCSKIYMYISRGVQRSTCTYPEVFKDIHVHIQRCLKIYMYISRGVQRYTCTYPEVFKDLHVDL